MSPICLWRGKVGSAALLLLMCAGEAHLAAEYQRRGRVWAFSLVLLMVLGRDCRWCWARELGVCGLESAKWWVGRPKRSNDALGR